MCLESCSISAPIVCSLLQDSVYAPAILFIINESVHYYHKSNYKVCKMSINPEKLQIPRNQNNVFFVKKQWKNTHFTKTLLVNNLLKQLTNWSKFVFTFSTSTSIVYMHQHHIEPHNYLCPATFENGLCWTVICRFLFRVCIGDVVGHIIMLWSRQLCSRCDVKHHCRHQICLRETKCWCSCFCAWISSHACLL